jgi:hypothetical protein
MAENSRNQILSPVGVCILPPPAHNASRTVQYGEYIYEIMDAAGLCYTKETAGELPARLSGLGVLLTIGESKLADETSAALREWVKGGGTWISVAGVCGLDDVLGVQALPAAYAAFGGGLGTLGEGYLKVEAAGHPVLGHLEIPLHYFNGAPLAAVGAKVLARGLDAHGRGTERPVVTENVFGEGLAVCIAPDITGSVVLIQQGRGGVTRDGVPAPDGTAPVCDEVLKSGDGGVLDWLLDREPVPGVEGLSAFLQPIADQWRELLLRAIFYGAHRRGVRVPVLWLYPRNLGAIAHISLDTDNNDPDHAELLFDALEEKGVKATWCTIMPGLPQDFMFKIHEAGHELAMHYDAMTDGLHWGADQFTSQWRYLVELFGGRAPVTNKNHYLRWEGDTDIWTWCEAHGIQIDQSKGASKTGEAGFNFGTCRPYFPVGFRGEKLDVLELPTYTQDLEVFIPKAFLPALMKPVIKHHGVLHLLFHPAHTHKPATNQALREAADAGRAAGLEWWTAAQINQWERARRTVKWTDYAASGEAAEVTVGADAELPEATILWMGAPVSNASDGNDQDARWGFEATVEVINLSGGATHRATPAVEANS